MAKTIVVCGYGSGISHAVARKFASEGFQVALVARDAKKLEEAAKSLSSSGSVVRAFPCDLADSAAIAPLIAKIRGSLGSIAVLHWNAYASLAGDLTRADLGELRTTLEVGVISLVAAIQQVLPDLRELKGSAAVLVTGGGYALYDPQVDQMAAQFGSMGLAISKAAQHKLVGILHQKLKGEGIYAGEVTVLGLVKGTAHDRGNATIDPSTVADRFWEMYRSRTEPWSNVT
jgi:NADP-dependent 3-hydroxy acid dehydrogenase YdfG